MRKPSRIVAVQQVCCLRRAKSDQFPEALFFVIWPLKPGIQACVVRSQHDSGADWTDALAVLPVDAEADEPESSVVCNRLGLIARTQSMVLKRDSQDEWIKSWAAKTSAEWPFGGGPKWVIPLREVGVAERRFQENWWILAQWEAWEDATPPRDWYERLHEFRMRWTSGVMPNSPGEEQRALNTFRQRCTGYLRLRTAVRIGWRAAKKRRISLYPDGPVTFTDAGWKLGSAKDGEAHSG